LKFSLFPSLIPFPFLRIVLLLFFFIQRVKPSLLKFNKLIEEFPLGDPHHMELMDRVMTVRAKFKVIIAKLGLQSAFKQQANSVPLSF
jgi:hypothetical protein